MSDALPDDKLEAIRERLAAGTKGAPWFWEVATHRRWASVMSSLADERERFIAQCVDDDIADFIAHAPTDIAALMAEVDRLRAESAEIEYGIVRPSQTPSMSGRPLWVQITGATFSTREQAERALRNVPSLRDKEYAARVVSRRAPGSWCLVEEGDQP